MAASDNHIITVGNLDAVADALGGRFAAKSAATAQADGLMSKDDKAELDGLAALRLGYDESGGTSYISLVEEGD